MKKVKKKAKAASSSNKELKNPGKTTRELVVKTAIDCLVESHLHGLRYSQISKMADIPQPLMGYHFPTLESLMMEMVQSELEKLKVLSTQAVEKHTDAPKKALEAYIRVPFELSQKDKGFRAVWSAFYHLAVIQDDFRDLNRTVRTVGRERITNLLTMTLASERRFPSKMSDLTQLAIAIQGIVTGFAFMAATQTDGDYKQMADLAVKMSFNLIDNSFSINR